MGRWRHRGAHQSDSTHGLSLATAPAGILLRVVRRTFARGVQMQLDGIGIHVGDVVKVVENAPFHGPVLVEVAKTQVRVAVGRGLAGKVEVIPVSSASENGD